ncbi:MAG: 4-diphosphocytidyl-2-C-methyl-D-erythritol kinase [Hyphococcus sp.]|nr:MAG: 4-diphosphocytidyl-2-C-methyl-D-erythritol kinase [Marinicaulis sp.]
MITETAPAKLNLYLHIGPVRKDGLHDLASLFVFTKSGDEISVRNADQLSLEIIGPLAAALGEFPIEDNLVLKAAQLLQTECGVSKGAAITLDKRLPIAAGIGGGSADAAAALRALIALWKIDISDAQTQALAFRLGADVPACLKGAPVIVSGAGERLSAGPVLPPLWACLVNPGVPVPTGPIFQAFDAANLTPAAPTSPSIGERLTPMDVQELMAETRNDLEAPAMALAPKIEAVLGQLNAIPGVIAARMSGSGATCFALFGTAAEAAAAAKKMSETGAWAMASSLISG